MSGGERADRGEGDRRAPGPHRLPVRQSTLRQVLTNTESTARQYALRQKAIALGWPAEAIVTIDTDQGQSGASAASTIPARPMLTSATRCWKPSRSGDRDTAHRGARIRGTHEFLDRGDPTNHLLGGQRHQAEIGAQLSSLIRVLDQRHHPAGDGRTFGVVPCGGDYRVIGDGVDVGEWLAVDPGVRDGGCQVLRGVLAARGGPVLVTAEADELQAGVGIRTLIHMDDPEHRVVRAIGADWFRPKAMRALKVRIDELARIYVDKMIAVGPECDFVQQVAVNYPLYVIMSLLGVPESDFPLMLKLTQELFGSDDDEYKHGATSEEQMSALLEMFEYFTALTVYAGTKFAVVGLSTAMADEFAPHGIHVSVVMPPSPRPN